METENYGTDKVKKVIDFGITFGDELKNALEDDGHLDIGEIVGFGDNLIDLVSIIRNIESVKKQFLDIDLEEKKKLVQYFQQKFSHDKEKTEKRIEAAFGMLMELKILLWG